MRSLISLLAFVAIPAGFGMSQEKYPAHWDAPLCKPVDRETVHEFTREPTLKKVAGDLYEISFACKAKGDVAVAIEDAGGRIVKHIVYGVLGPNAPLPLKKDALDQTLTWDGKDEFGKYFPRPEECRARVSLGLNPTFDKIIGYHPKDTSGGRIIAAIAADKDGVYVLEGLNYGTSQLRKYDHDANYVSTIYPWDPDKLDKVMIPKRTLPDAKIWDDGKTPAGSKVSPLHINYGATAPFGNVENYTCMAAAAGKIACFTKGHFHDIRRLMRLRSDGTSAGEPVEGARFTEKANSYAGQGHIALSPDGKWVYVTGMSRKPPLWRDGLALPGYGENAPFLANAVFRIAWDAQGVVVEGNDSFLGEVSRDAKKGGADVDNEHFSGPQGLACDAEGRLHVADLGNNRIQVFSPEGKYLKTIPVKDPQEIAVHPKTGEIYVLCFRRAEHGIRPDPIILVKLGPYTEPTERFRQKFLPEGDSFVSSVKFTPVMALDAWAAEPRIWMVNKQGVVRVYADKGKELTLIDDFEEDVRKAGHTPHSINGGHMGYISVDPLRGHVYSGRSNIRRIDPEEGKTWQKIDLSRFPKSRWASGALEEVTFSWDGLLHARSLQFIARFNPDKFGTPIKFDASAEVPFDYGSEMGSSTNKGEREPELRGVISIPWAIGGANGYNNGIGVSPRGEVVALIENFQDFELFKKPSASNPTGYFDGNEFKALLKDNEDRFRPTQFPGRPWSHGNLVWRFARTGQVVSVDAIPGLPYSSFGIRTDAANSIYCGVGYHKNEGGKPHIAGSVAKFAPKGGRLIRDFDTPVKLEDPPQRAADFLTINGGKIWGQNMFWAAPGLDQLNMDGGTNYPCECYHCKFDTDLYGRTFMPRAYGYHVAVLDAAGNRICEIGRYGNADKPAMKPGDGDIGLGQCSYLATLSDKWLYIADDSNLRIIRVRLGYHVEKRAVIGGLGPAAK